MAAGAKSQAEKFALREQKRVQNHMPDPESDASPDAGGSSGSDASDNERAATAHYVDVGKSKLRRREVVPLGPAYRGTRVSRAAFEESSDGNEDGDEDEEEQEHDEDDEDESAIAPGAGGSRPRTVNGRRHRPTAADFMASSGSEDALDGGFDEEDDDEEGSEDEEDDGLDDEDTGDLLSSEDDESGPHLNGLIDDEAEEDSDEGTGEDSEGSPGDGAQVGDSDDSDDEPPKPTKKGSGSKSKKGDEGGRAELRQIFGQAQKHIVTSMSEAAKADAEKGLAVRQQRRTFDAVLNLRIRLQKALVAANSFGTLEDSQGSGEEAYQAAEEAAVRLWNTIGGLRDRLLPENKAKAGEKRKREVSLDTPSASIWEAMETTEDFALLYRRKVLDKWSAKVRQPTTLVKTRQLKDTPAQSLASTLDDQLLNVDRFVQRAHVPRSCAPAQAAKKVSQDPAIYDDGDFYQLLLKELVEQRSGDLSGTGASVSTIKWAAVREAKNRKEVDRKASKGRKLRYAVVHEKLQNFMVSEDRRRWEQEAIDKFFGTLFGQKMELKEDEELSDEEMGDIDAEAAGLRLFRG